MLLVYTLDVTFQDNYKMYIRPHSYGMRPDVHGISHGLNKCPLDTCLHQCAHWCRPFDSFLGSTIKNSRPKAAFFMATVDNNDTVLYGCIRVALELQPSEENAALMKRVRQIGIYRPAMPFPTT